LALFALLVQFALSFGHFHPLAAQAAPAIHTAFAQANIAHTAGLSALDAVSEAAQQQPPSNHDNDQRPADGCAICTVMALASSVLFASPPKLLLPDAIEVLFLVTDAEFAHLGSLWPAFQSRAPPVS
jgi:Protein of unknown function (DUF2946)